MPPVSHPFCWSRTYLQRTLPKVTWWSWKSHDGYELSAHVKRLQCKYIFLSCAHLNPLGPLHEWNHCDIMKPTKRTNIIVLNVPQGLTNDLLSILQHAHACGHTENHFLPSKYFCRSRCSTSCVLAARILYKAFATSIQFGAGWWFRHSFNTSRFLSVSSEYVLLISSRFDWGTSSSRARRSQPLTSSSAAIRLLTLRLGSN